MAPPLRILAMDGGGIRGLIPALVVQELERVARRPVASLFDLVIGTSTGGLLALALTRPDAPPASELPAIYERDGPGIFARSLGRRIRTGNGVLGPRYDGEALRETLTRQFGAARLRDATTPVAVCAYETRLREPWFFRSERARADPAYDFPLADAAYATAAAPTYFPPALIVNDATRERWSLVDGGVFAANPALAGYVDALSAGTGDRDLLVVSLGTGVQTRPYPYEEIRGWGQLGWVRPVIDVMLDGQSDAVDHQLGALLGSDGYVRLQTPLEEASDDLDDASRVNLRRLRAEAERLIGGERERIAGLAARLSVA